jgi:HlyD family secretion protein
MRKMPWLILPVLALLGASLIYFFYFRKAGPETNTIRISGNFEVTEVQISFKIPGRVEQRPVDEGQLVQKDECVATLETTDMQAEVRMREAELLSAQSKLAELQAGSRPAEIEAAKARLSSAQADRDRLESDFRSAQLLLKTKVISDEEYVRRKGLFDAAAGRWQEAAEQLKLVQEGARQEVREQARAQMEQAKAALELAQTRLSYARLTSPLTGVVLAKSIEPGEYVAPGTPIVTIGEISKPWLRAYVDERDLGRVKLGQKVRVTTDTYPGRPYEGRLSFIASQAEFTPKNVQTEKERVKLVYRVKIDVPNPKLELKPGMPDDAEILLGSGTTPYGGN